MNSLTAQNQRFLARELLSEYSFFSYAVFVERVLGQLCSVEVANRFLEEGSRGG